MRVLLQEKQNKFWYKKIRLNITARIFFATKMFLIEAGRKKRPIESQKLGKENDENKKNVQNAQSDRYIFGFPSIFRLLFLRNNSHIMVKNTLR